jgi:hypothetical protein
VPGGKRKGAGRKAIAIDASELEKLCALQCTHEDLAAWFGCSTRTIEKLSKQPDYAEVMARGRARGRISVRRAQMKLLEAGNATMGVWLGKQMLGQRDVTPIELSGRDGQPLQIGLEVINDILWSGKKDEKSQETSGRSGPLRPPFSQP